MSDLIDLETAQGQVPNYLRNVAELAYDPQALQRQAIGHTEEILGGTVRVTDPTNPFVTLLGISAANTSAAILANQASLRRRYEVLATNPQELYHHLSDVDYNGRFATPHTQKVLCLVAMAELKPRMVQQADGSRKIVIPRYSRVVVEDTVFTLMYPVVIREMAHGSLSVHYDLSTAHPLLPMTSSLVYWTERETSADPETKFLQLELDMLQVRTAIYALDMNPSTGFDRLFKLSDNFCSAQVWSRGQSAAQWRELKVTHSDMVYDASVPTAVLAVTGDQLRVRIPQIYFTSGLVTGKLRIALYTTKGPVYINASGKALDNFQSTWSAEDGEPVSAEVAAWQALTSKFFFFQGIANGGGAALSFEQLRANVINGAMVQDTPITPSQLNVALQRDGFTIRKHVDTVTGRQLLASKPLPASRDKDLITPGSATIGSVVSTLGALKSSPWVSDNQDRVTITPTALWQIRGGVVRLTDPQELIDMSSQDPETRVSMVNAGNYLYSPYYYVLDTALDRFAVRPYHLDEPTAVVDKFIGENETTGLQIEIGAMQIINTGNGWELQVHTLSNQAWKNQDAMYRMAQLSFNPPGVGAPAAINGELVVGDDGEDVFVFSMPSGYDIDNNHKISHIGFHAITADPREVYSDLSQIFRLTFVTGAPMPADARGHAMDDALVTASLPVRKMSVAAQQIKVQFGVYLKNLWAACRSMAPVQPWQTYPADVPAVATEDLYEINPITGTSVFIDADGKPSFRKIRSAGDTLVDANGNVIYEHRKGDVVYAGGAPVPVGNDAVQRQFDMLFLEGCYFFATDASTTQYSREITQILTNYITDNLPNFEKRVTEITNIFFYPSVSLGSVTALIDDGVVAQIQADQSLTVRLGVHPHVNENIELIEQIKKKTIQVIDKSFKNEVITVSDLVRDLQTTYAGDVISIHVSGLGGSMNANAVTLINANERFSLKKRLFMLDNGEFTVREVVVIDIFNHTNG